MATFKELTNSTTPTLVDFFAEWCQPCKMMAPILNEVAKDLGDSVRIIKIDVDKNQSLAAQLKIQGVPTLAIYKEGKMVWRQSGVFPAHELKKIISQYQ